MLVPLKLPFTRKKGAESRYAQMCDHSIRYMFFSSVYFSVPLSCGITIQKRVDYLIQYQYVNVFHVWC